MHLYQYLKEFLYQYDDISVSIYIDIYPYLYCVLYQYLYRNLILTITVWRDEDLADVGGRPDVVLGGHVKGVVGKAKVRELRVAGSDLGRDKRPEKMLGIRKGG